MVLALPLQGMAAVARLHCGSADPGVSVRAGHAEHHAGHAADHAHHGHAAMQAAVMADGASDLQPPSALPHGVGHSCSACAACCAGLGLPAATTVLAEPDLANVPVMAAGQPAFHFIASGPERPPRSDLA